MSETSTTDRASTTCPFCGGESFTDGEVPTYGPMQFVKSFPDGRKPAGQPVHARKCDQCGNVQLFVGRKRP
jgi:hypothetical protein